MCGEYVFDSCAAELTEEDTEELTAFCEPPDGEYSDVVAKRPRLTTSLWRNAFIADNFLEVDYFMGMCLKLKHKIVPVMGP